MNYKKQVNNADEKLPTYTNENIFSMQTQTMLYVLYNYRSSFIYVFYMFLLGVLLSFLILIFNIKIPT